MQRSPPAPLALLTYEILPKAGCVVTSNMKNVSLRFCPTGQEYLYKPLLNASGVNGSVGGVVQGCACRQRGG